MATLLQGTFVSTGLITPLNIPTDVDYLEIENLTTMAAGGAGTGVRYTWTRGLAVDTGFEYVKAVATNVISEVYLAAAGFTLVNTSDSPIGLLNNLVTAVAAGGVPPVVTAVGAWPDPLVAGDVVRMINVTGAQQLGGIDFTVDTVTANTNFTLAFMAPIVAGTAGFFRKIKWAPLFYPVERTITKIRVSPANPAWSQVSLSVTHGYTVGQKVAFRVPLACGMTQMNGLVGTIQLINTADANAAINTITVDIDCNAFTAFAFPLTAAAPFTPAQVVPVGEETTAPFANLLDDATRNIGFRGMLLAPGVNGPAGVATNVISWKAWKSDNL